MIQGLLPQKLRLLRAERKLSLRQAAKLTGLAKETLGDIERGKRHPNDVTLAKIAEGYDVSLQELFDLEESAAPLAPASPSPAPEKAPLAKEERRASATREDVPEEEQVRRIKLFCENVNHFTNQWQEELKHPGKQDPKWAMGVQAMATGFQEIAILSGVWRSKKESSKREWDVRLELLHELVVMHDTADRVLKASNAVNVKEAAERRRANFELVRGKLSA